MFDKKTTIAIAICLTTSVIIGVFGFIYHDFSSRGKQVFVEMILSPQNARYAGLASGNRGEVPLESQKLIYENVMILIDNVSQLEVDGPAEAGGTSGRSSGFPGLENALAEGIHRIALGNQVSDDEVRTIVRRGWANRW